MSRNSGHVIDGKGKPREAPEKKPGPIRKVVPILFVPGIAGSNLRIKPDQRAQVREDLELKEPIPLPRPWAPPAWPWPLKKELELWKGFSPRFRQILLNHETTEVDSKGFLEGGTQGITPDDLQSASQSFRGLASVNTTIYNGILSFLEALEPWVNARHKDAHSKPVEDLSATELPYHLQRLVPGSSFEGNLRELEKRGLGNCRIPLATARKVCQYCLPVFAVGYNWLQSNRKSAADLLSAIKKIIDLYNKAEAADGSRPFTCRNVVLVTHSMGGLVARSAFKKDQGADHSRNDPPRDACRWQPGHVSVDGSRDRVGRLRGGHSGATGECRSHPDGLDAGTHDAGHGQQSGLPGTPAEHGPPSRVAGRGLPAGGRKA